jgi:hypothetical protein
MESSSVGSKAGVWSRSRRGSASRAGSPRSVMMRGSVPFSERPPLRRAAFLLLCAAALTTAACSGSPAGAALPKPALEAGDVVVRLHPEREYQTMRGARPAGSMTSAGVRNRSSAKMAPLTGAARPASGGSPSCSSSRRARSCARISATALSATAVRTSVVAEKMPTARGNVKAEPAPWPHLVAQALHEPRREPSAKHPVHDLGREEVRLVGTYAEVPYPGWLPGPSRGDAPARSASGPVPPSASPSDWPDPRLVTARTRARSVMRGAKSMKV